MLGTYSSKINFLFDLDGTLVDSASLHERAFIQTLMGQGGGLEQQFDYAAIAGKPTREVFQSLGFVREPELNELTREKQERYRLALTQGELQVFTGAVELLEQLARKNSRLFLVTGANRISTDLVLASTGLKQFFEGIVTADDVSNGKPSPEPYVRALELYGLNTFDCLVIEDSELGVSAAHGAGLDVLLIRNPHQIPNARNVPDFESLGALLS